MSGSTPAENTVSLNSEDVAATLPTAEQQAADALVGGSQFAWHQRFRLAASVYGPGANDIEWLMQQAGLPTDLTGQSLIDIGTTNGGAAFEAERRGATRVVAVDIFDEHAFGFREIADFLDSRAEFVRASVYDLPQIADEQFDHVLLLGVLYHLRHPLLALDAVRALTREGGMAYIETAVCDAEVGDGSAGVVRYYRNDELADDASNWFAPSAATLIDWCESSGLNVQAWAAWPEESPTRALARVTPSTDRPEFERISYERRMFDREIKAEHAH